ncbi:hypothetical protein C8Q79DRAFT_1011533 [Trametes meyenii]|nr:hypothetical protein C8Q79DRAFT_1011533 [Trametes meyenii]
MQAFSALITLATFVVYALGTPAPSTNLTGPVALYSNNCKGSGFCSNSIRTECETAIATVHPGSTYTDQAQFSVGHCYMIYATNGAGEQAVSGQLIIDAANTILENCDKSCGSFGTNNAGCSSCHVTLNYRA